MYQGGEHGCVNCYARPSHTCHGLSAGVGFESQQFFKPNAPKLFRDEFEKSSYRPNTIALGVNTDCHQAVERSE